MTQLYIPGTASPGDVLATKTFSAGTNYKASGTMPNNGALNLTPGAAAISIPSGYTSGGTVSGDANLIAANILSGKSIFGVAGSVIPRKYATGTVTRSVGTATFTYVTTSRTVDLYYITVSGLSFEPKIIVAYCRFAALGIVYSTMDDGFNGSGSFRRCKAFKFDASYVRDLPIHDIQADISPAYVNSTGFQLPSLTGSTTDPSSYVYEWVAFAD